MLAKAHRRSPGSAAGRFARLGTAVLLCVASVLAATHAEASAANPLTRTLDTVAHATASDVSSTVGTVVAPAVGALPAPPTQAVAAAPSPSGPGEPAAPPASSPSSAPPAGAQLHAVARSLGDGARETGSGPSAAPGSVVPANSRQAAKQPVAPTAERGPVSAVLRTVAPRDARAHPVGDVVRRATGAVAGTHAAVAVERVLAPSSGASQIVGALARAASSVVGGVARDGDTIGGLASSVLDPAVASLRSLGLIAATPPQVHDALAPTIVASEPRHDALAAASLEQLVPGRWSGAIADLPLTSPPGTGGKTTAALATTAPLAPRASSPASHPLDLTAGQSAVSSPARAVPGASLPVRPAPVSASSSPVGGASPATAVGSGGGIAVALALAALLLLAAPPAMRRLRLVAESWRRAPLLLIADRPG